MTHPRKVLRQAFQSRLLNATPAADRVFDTMTPPIEMKTVLIEEGPVIMVYVRHQERREEDYPKSREDGGVKNRMEVAIEVLATGANVDDTLDDMAEVIEGLIQDWDIPDFPSAQALLIDAQIDVSNAQDHIVGGLFMTFHVNVWTAFRPDASETFLPQEVYARTLETAPDLIVDDAHLVWPAVP